MAIIDLLVMAIAKRNIPNPNQSSDQRKIPGAMYADSAYSRNGLTLYLEKRLL